MVEKQLKLQEKKFANLDRSLVEKVLEFQKELKEKNYEGIFCIDDEVYHNCVGFSKSQLDKVNKSPKHFYYDFLNPKEPNEAMKLGSLVHAAVLQPTLLKTKYIADGGFMQDNKCSRLTKAYKSWKAEMEQEGYTVMKQEDFEMCAEMMKSVFGHEKLQNILTDGVAERAVFTVDEKTGLVIKCKVDYMLLKDGINFDLKTTQDASIDYFSRSILNFRYYVQSAYYNYICSKATAIPFKTFIFGALEKQAPYDISIYYADETCMEVGKKHFIDNLITLVECLNNDNWHGYSRDIEPISLPHYALWNE